jgi:hypothetical protein
MKKIQILALSLMLLCGTNAFAGFTATIYDTIYNEPSPAGEYKVVTSGASFVANYDSKAIFGNGFSTFCIDRYDSFTYGVAYNATLSSYLWAGTGNKLSLGSAYLYSQFALGTLAGYSYTGTTARNTSADWLQKTLWALEGQGYSSVLAASNPFYNQLVTMFGSTAGAQADANGAYGVKVLQLTDDCDEIKQSQLVLCNPPVPHTTPIPEPSTVVAGALLLLPFGVSALRIIRRKNAAMK